MNVRTTVAQSPGSSGAAFARSRQSGPLRPQALPSVAVARFLKDMKTAAEKTFSSWHKTLVEGLEECALTSDTRFALLKLHPLDDYYFAAAVALEAAKIRQLFRPRGLR